MKLILRKLDLKKDIGKKYQQWLNSSEVQKFTEQRYKKHTIKEIKKFVKEKNISKNEFLFGIFLEKNRHKIHIGNIKLGPINFIHKRGDIGYFIGEKKLWNKGYASLAIKKIASIAKKMGLKKIKAGAYEMNKGSAKVLKKNGFKVEGKLKSEIVFKKKRYSYILYGKIL